MHIISLGCNCHPAYWLKKTKLNCQTFPFDWLLMRRPHLGIDYILDVYQKLFSDFTQDLTWNQRGHPVAKNYPLTEFFHHHSLLSEQVEDAILEREKLRRRIERFVQAVKRPVKFVYCYFLYGESMSESAITHFSRSVDRLLQQWQQAELLVYFLSDDKTSLQLPILPVRKRLSVELYYRDKEIDKNWGAEPYFLSELASS
jgi:hypothetical protein